MCDLNNDDDRKFSMQTPEMISRGVKQLIEGHLPDDGVPSSQRIVNDCDSALDAMRKMCDNQGAIVPGLVDRNGKGYDADGTFGQGGG